MHPITRRLPAGRARTRTLSLAALTLAALSSTALTPALAQSRVQSQAPDANVTPLPQIEVQSSEQAQDGETGPLTVPSVAQAQAAIDRTPGGAALVTDQQWEDGPSATIKDMLDYVPGVFAQPKWGEDTRLSIRGSGIARNNHLRGILLYQDGIPFNSADGSGDFQEIDPTAYRFVEVFRGANGYQFGANALGGAINFVSPTGYDTPGIGARLDGGSFGFMRAQANAGGVNGAFDGFITGSWLSQDGYREHSSGEATRGSANVGWRPTDNFETRFYLQANDIKQNIPGAVTKQVALTDPTAANPASLRLDYERNVQSVRLANKSAWVINENTKLEFGGYVTDKSLDHPIFQVLDYQYNDYGVFARAVDERLIGGYANRLTTGVIASFGHLDADRYFNNAGTPTYLTFSAKEKATTTTFYAEDNFYLTPDFALVGAFQYLSATRERDGIYAVASGEQDYNLFLPKGGFVWAFAPGAELYGNISRSGEVPTMSELNNFSSPIFGNIEAQTAVTYEIGTRGQTPDLDWDISLYRSNVSNELQCQQAFSNGVPLYGACNVVNLDSTVHQGLELGFGAALWKGIFVANHGRASEMPAKAPAAPVLATDALWLNVAYTYSDFFFDDDPVWGNNQLPGIPPHYLRAELLYKHPSGFYAGPNVEWVPEAYYVDDANTLDTEPYALLNFRIGYDNGRNFSAYLDARNLTNETYIASTSVVAYANANSAVFEPGNGRAFYAGIRLTW